MNFKKWRVVIRLKNKNQINILHLNTNFQQSSIYPNMFRSFNELANVSGKLYYPIIKTNSFNTNIEHVDVSHCLTNFDKFFYFHRNKKLTEDITSLNTMNDFNICLAYSLFSNGYLAYTLNKKFGIPYVVIVQNTDVNMYFKKMLHLRGIGRTILRNAVKVVFISEPYKEFVLNEYFSDKDKKQIFAKSVVIPFGIDEYWFENKLRERKKLNNKKIKLLYVGKLNKNKNVISTAKACELLHKMGYEVCLTVVGDDAQDNKLTENLSVYDFIKYKPFTNQVKLKTIYREHDIFVMPSIKESFGLVYGEAMSQGLPIIYTRGQGFDKQFKEGEVGYSVDPYNIKEIAGKVIQIISNYDTVTRNCIKLVDKLNWSNIVAEYKENCFDS